MKLRSGKLIGPSDPTDSDQSSSSSSSSSDHILFDNQLYKPRMEYNPAVVPPPMEYVRPPVQQVHRRYPRLELPTYDGTTDPIRFLQIFAEACEICGEVNPPDKLRLFPHTLKGAAQDWYFNQTLEE